MTNQISNKNCNGCTKVLDMPNRKFCTKQCYFNFLKKRNRSVFGFFKDLIIKLRTFNIFMFLCGYYYLFNDQNFIFIKNSSFYPLYKDPMVDHFYYLPEDKDDYEFYD